MFLNPSFNLLLLLFVNLQPSSTFKLRSVQLNMYVTSSFDFCLRYLTKNSIAGCSSTSSGNRGRLINIASLNDLTSSNRLYPIVVLIPARKDILEYAIFHAPLVVGILIDGGSLNTTDDPFTDVNTCPENFVGSSTCSIRKNRYGIDFRGQMIDKPIFLLTNQTIIEQIREISSRYNQQKISEGRHIDAHLKSYPYGVNNAEICNRRSKSTYFSEAYFKHYSIKCRSPMINIVWSTFNAIAKKNIRPAKSVIIFYTKFDFFSIFQPKNAGVQSTATGVVTLLGLAWILGRINLSELLISNKDHKDVLFLFINGENWNYYGRFELSRMILEKRFPYTIEKSSGQDNLHPIEAEHIDIIINIDQLGIHSDETYILYDTMHPFLEKFQTISTSITLQTFPDNFDSLSDFRLLNISTLALITNAYENMNPFYNSYRDTFINMKDDYSSIETHISSLAKTICLYFKLSTCLSDLSSLVIKQTLIDRIDALFDCFLRSNCSKIISSNNETDVFHFKEVVNQMKENFSFLQPILHQFEVKSYINKHFLDASSYIHDILLNWIAIRTTPTSRTACEEIEDVFRWRIYQESTDTCLRVSIDSINLIRSTNETIDERMIFVSNYDEPELLIYMINNTKRDLIMLICGIVLSICGLILTYLLTKLFPVIFNQEEEI